MLPNTGSFGPIIFTPLAAPASVAGEHAARLALHPIAAGSPRLELTGYEAQKLTLVFRLVRINAPPFVLDPLRQYDEMIDLVGKAEALFLNADYLGTFVLARLSMRRRDVHSLTLSAELIQHHAHAANSKSANR